MTERIISSLGILLAGLFESKHAPSPSDPCLLPAELPSEPPPPYQVKRADSGVHRIR
jgi:hypothetical protein